MCSGLAQRQGRGRPAPHLLAKRYIHEHYHEPLTLHSVSTVIGFNPSYFSSVFKRETGENFLDYLTNERIVGAKELLVSTSLSVGEIAEKVGYQDLKYFYKRFKQSTGLGPKEYRKLYG
jgi:two-component system response regulator YesN